MSQSRLSKSLRDQVAEYFKQTCAYCQTQRYVSGSKLTIDHIIPEVAGGLSVASNLCLSCWDCNLFKSAKVIGFDPSSNEDVRLFDPRQQVWDQRFRWNDGSTLILGITPAGRATVIELKLNRPELVLRQGWIDGNCLRE